MERMLHDDRRVEHHSDTDEENHRERVTQRQRLNRRPMRILRFAHDHAGKKSAERERDVKDFRSAECDSDRDCQHT